MNTLRRIPRFAIKAVAAGAVMVAAALPIATVASAATPATLTCSWASAGSVACPSSNTYGIIGQGYSGGFYIAGTGFANDQPLGGNVTLTTTAPSVVFTNVQETATTVTATISSSSATTPGFYPVTLTDDNGAATMALGLGVDVGPQITAAAGNAGTAGGAASTVTVTGMNLQNSTVSFNGATGAPAVASEVTNLSDTSITFNVNNAFAGTKAGTYPFTITAPYPTNGGSSDTFGVATGSYTVNAAATPLTITSVTPNELGIPVSGVSTVTSTVSGTGFEAGAVLTIASPAGTTEVGSSFVNSTTMTLTLNVAAGATTGQVDITVHNPDATTLLGTGLIGIGVPAASLIAGNTPPVAPVILSCSAGCSLTPGVSEVLLIQGSSTFPMTTGSTVTLTGSGQTVHGTVLSVDATNTARVLVKVPRFATTTTTAALTATSTTIPLTSVTGMPASGDVIISDGANSQGDGVTTVPYASITGNSLNITAGAVGAHASGVTVEFNFPAVATYVLAVNNGTYTESWTPVTVNADVAAAYVGLPSLTTLPTPLVPGTFTVNAYVPGFGFGAGAAVFFGNTGAGVLNGITGTVTAVSESVATISVTVPAVETALNTFTLAAPATPGQNALTLASNAGLVVGNKITVNADAFYLTPETFTVTSVLAGGVVGVTPAVADNHSTGATVSDLSSPQATSGNVNAVLTNGSGQAVGINPFFGLTTPGTITAYSLSATGVGTGASAAPITFTTSAATTAPATGWTVSSTYAGVTFGAVTAVGGTTVTTINVAASTVPSAAVPVTITNGLATYTGTISVVAGPTITAVTTVGTLSAGGTETVGLTGTNFDFSAGHVMTCSTSDPAVTCAITPEVTDSATIATVTISLLTPSAALNGTDSLTLTNSGTAIPLNYGAGTLAGAFKVAGQPTATAIAPTVVTQGVAATQPQLTVTGTLIPALTTCFYTIYTPALAVVSGPTACAAVDVSATSATITAASYATAGDGGDTIAFTLGNATSTFVTPSVAIQANPVALFYKWNSMFSPNIRAGSASVPFKVVGSSFGAGATVSIPAADGTVTVTQVTPNAIFGTVSFLNSVNVNVNPAGPDVDVTGTITNTNGGAGTFTFFVSPAPTITLPAIVNSYVISNSSTSLVLTGTALYPGAVVTAGLTQVATLGTAVASNGAAACAVGPCTTLTVPLTNILYNNSGIPIITSLTVTNPVGEGSVTTSNALTLDPAPVVTGVYYVPTFSTNIFLTINGSGFLPGITATSSNTDYTVVAVGSTPTTVTLLVSTDAQATTGTSSTITLKNLDGGMTTFTLNGGPVPTPPTTVSSVGGRPARIGKTTVFTIHGTNLANAVVTVHKAGVSVRVLSNNGTTLRVAVKVTKKVHTGTSTLHIVTNANGVTVGFSIKKPGAK